jgi:hypothetical protein
VLSFVSRLAIFSCRIAISLFISDAVISRSDTSIPDWLDFRKGLDDFRWGDFVSNSELPAEPEGQKASFSIVYNSRLRILSINLACSGVTSPTNI